MKKRLAATALLVSLVTGCASTIQSASMMEAHKHFKEGELEETLTLISRAESAAALSPDQTASLTYLKAQVYEDMGEVARATTLYEYLREQHPASQYAYLAALRLEVHQ